MPDPLDPRDPAPRVSPENCSFAFATGGLDLLFFESARDQDFAGSNPVAPNLINPPNLGCFFSSYVGRTALPGLDGVN
jgi:hypothetical protein